jgi:uroporphyrinogen III methyltransferase/synthase
MEFPTIKVVPPEDWGPLDGAIEALPSYQWLLFTSVNGVKFFLQRLEVSAKDVRDLKGLKLGAIGPKTAETLQRMGIRPDLMPDEYRAEAVVECFKEWDIKGARILLPRAEKARLILPEELAKQGAVVDVVAAYRTVKPANDTGRLVEMLSGGAVHMVTFTSSSTVTNFIEMFGNKEDRLWEWMADVSVACIGPITAKTAQEQGFTVDLVPPKYTIESLTDGIVAYFREKGNA